MRPSTHISRPSRRIVGALCATLSLSGAAVITLAGPALASTATQTVSAGTLAFVSAPGNPSLSAITLNGTNQTASGTLPMDIGDNTGSGAGWDVTATSTTFTNGSTTSPESLSTTGTTVQGAPTNACDSGVTCTLATNTITYPYTLPAASTAPTATKIYNAGTNTGMADQTVTPTFKVAIPANTYAGTYTSTWTISLVSGP